MTNFDCIDIEIILLQLKTTSINGSELHFVHATTLLFIVLSSVLTKYRATKNVRSNKL